MITMLNLKCPNCGGELQVQSDREFCFCQYCGTKILLSDENKKTININKNVTYTTVNEADKLRAENERLKFEAEQSSKKETKENQIKLAKSLVKFGPIVAIVGFVIDKLVPSTSGIASLATAAYGFGLAAFFGGAALYVSTFNNKK